MSIESLSHRKRTVESSKVGKIAQAAALGAGILAGAADMSPAEAAAKKPEITQTIPAKKSLEKPATKEVIIMKGKTGDKRFEIPLQAPRPQVFPMPSEPEYSELPEPYRSQWRKSDNIEIERPSGKVVKYREDIFEQGFWKGVKKALGFGN